MYVHVEVGEWEESWNERQLLAHPEDKCSTCGGCQRNHCDIHDLFCPGTH